MPALSCGIVIASVRSGSFHCNDDFFSRSRPLDELRKVRLGDVYRNLGHTCSYYLSDLALHLPPAYHAALGGALLRQGLLVEAEAVLSAAVLLEPDSEEYRRLLVEVKWIARRPRHAAHPNLRAAANRAAPPRRGLPRTP